MNFHYDIDKAIAATAYLIQKAGGCYHILHLVKALYWANRASLVKFGRSITGDRLVSMEAGPVVSNTYDLAKGGKWANPEDSKKWNQIIGRSRHDLILRGKPDFDFLSPRDVGLLDEAFDVVANVKIPLKEWSHQVFPEWQDPGNSSLPIDPKEILLAEKKHPEEIAEIEDELESINWLKSIAT